MLLHVSKVVVNIYVLKLEEGRYYVGKTNHTFQRFNQHATGQGAKWTKKYPVIDLHAFHPNMRDQDENKVTIQMMQKYGVKNVRGGSWTKVKMTEKEVHALESKISVRNNAKKRRQQGGMHCTRCGRSSHNLRTCYARFHADGSVLANRREIGNGDFQKFLHQYKENRLKIASIDDELSQKDVEKEVDLLQRIQKEDPGKATKIIQAHSEEEDVLDFLTLLTGSNYKIVKVIEQVVRSRAEKLSKTVGKNARKVRKKSLKPVKMASKKIRKFLK